MAVPFSSRFSVYGWYLPRLTGAGMLAVLLHILLTWPMLLNLGHAIAGPMSDPVGFFGQVWLVNQNLFHGVDSFAYTRMVYYPTGIFFIIRPLLGWYALLGWAGSFFHGNLVLWYNLSLILSSFLTAAGMWLLVYRLTRDQQTALLGALLYVFCSRRMDAMMGHINYYSTEFLVWTVVGFQLGLRRGTGSRPWALAGVVWGMQVWQTPDMTIFIGFAWGAFFCWRCWRMWVDHVEGRGDFRGWWCPLVAPVLVAVSVAPMLFAAWPYLHLELSSGGIPWPKTRWIEFLYPSPNLRLYAPWRMFLDRFHTPGHYAPFVGLSGLGSILLFFISGGWRLRRGRIWILFSAVALILTLGASVSLLGAVEMPLPYRAMFHIPVLKELRIPGRFNTLLMLGLSVLGSLGYAAWRGRGLRHRRLVFGLLAGMVLLDGCLAPVRFTLLRGDLEHYPDRLLEIIRQDRNFDISVLNVPIEIPNTRSMAQQFIHGHPTYDGVETRWQVEHYYQLLLGPFLYLLKESGEIPSIEVCEARMTVAEFRERIAPARLKYILLNERDSPHPEAHREIIRHYFPVAGEEREGHWILFTIAIPGDGPSDRLTGVPAGRIWTRDLP